MPTRDIRTRIALEGEKAYRDALAGLNREQRVLHSELKAVTSAFGDSQNSVEALTAKSVILNKEIDQQRIKVQSLEQAVQDASEKYKEGDAKLDGYRIQLNNAQASLNKMENELQNTTDSIKKQESAFSSLGTKLTEASAKMKDMGGKMSSAGNTMTVGLTAPTLAAAAGIGALVNNALQAADGLSQLSDVTGLSTERLQELTYVGTKLDVELDTITGAQKFLTKAMEAAQEGTKEQVLLFRELGVHAIDPLTGKLRDSNEVFSDVIAALGKMKNPTERDAAALKLMGKSAMDLNPLIKAGSAEIAKLTKEARASGAVMSGESVRALDEFGDELEAAKLSVKTAVSGIAVDMIPTLEKLMKTFKEKGIPAIKGVAETVGDLIEDFSNLSPEMQTAIIALIGVAAAAGPVTSGLGSMATGVSSLTNLFGTLSTKVSAAGGVMALLTSPVALVAATIGVLGGSILLLSGQFDEGVQSAQNFARECDNAAKLFKEASDEINTNSAAARELARRLEVLAEKENKSNGEKAEMKSLVSQLNNLVPELNLVLDEETGKLQQQAGAIDEIIKKQRLQMLLQKDQERWLELYAEEVTAVKELETAKMRLAKAQKEYDDALKFGGITYQGFMFELSLAEQAFTKHQTTLDNTRARIEELDAEEKKLAEDLYNSNQQMAISESTFSATQAAEYAARLENQKQYGLKTKEELTQEAADAKTLEDQRLQDAREYQSALEQSTQEHMNQMGDLDDKGITKSKLTAAQVKKNLDKQIQDFKTWQGSIKTLSSKVPDDVAADLEKLGPGSIKMIQGLNKMSKPELDAWIKTWREKTALAKSASEEELKKLPGAASVAASDAASAYANAMKSEVPDVKAAAEALAASAKTGVTVSLKGLGADAGQSFADGLRSKVSAVRAAAEALANAVPSSVRNELDMHSPSRVLMKDGGLSALSYAQGIVGEIESVTIAAQRMAAAAIPVIPGGALNVGSMNMRMNSAIAGGSAGGGGYATSSAPSSENTSPMQPVQLVVDGRVLGEIMLPRISRGLETQRRVLATAKGVN